MRFLRSPRDNLFASTNPVLFDIRMSVSAQRGFAIRTALALFGIAASVRGFAAQAPNFQQHVDQLNSKSEPAMMAAIEALTKAGSQAIPPLVEALDKRKECQLQFVASGVLRKIDPAHTRIEPALGVLARGECSGNSEQDFVLKQQAAFALSYSPSGITLLTDMVRHKDVTTRRRVAFAFEDLTEKLDSFTEEFRAPATLIEPTAQALPKLSPFLSDGDERVRCVTLEAMEQSRDSRHPTLADAAKATLAGKKVNCSR
jgi:HEAT repeat protein